jgi:hypothetical protein
MGVGGIADPRPHLMRAGLRLAALVIVACVAGATTCGCPRPRLPPVEGCRVGATRCAADRPQVCSSTGRWHDVGDLDCSAVGAVCVEGPARCQRAP